MNEIKCIMKKKKKEKIRFLLIEGIIKILLF